MYKPLNMPRMTLTPATQTTTRLQTKHIIGTVSGVALCALLAVLMLYDRPGEGRLPGYAWRMPVVTDTTLIQGEGALLNFPLLLHLQHDALRGQRQGGKVQHEMGYDLRFTRADGATPLYHRLKSYNPARGEIEVWVSVDTLHLDRPTAFFLYYSNPTQAEMPLLQTAVHRIRGYMTGEEGPAPILDAQTQARWLALETLNHQYPDRMVSLETPEEVAAPLPVTYDYLQTRVRGGSLVLVEFATLQEHDNDYFSIERSAEGMHFEPLDRMGGGDHSRDVLRYTFTDPRPLEGHSYYRIKQVNNNGDYSYSDLVLNAFNPHQKGLEVLGVNPATFRDQVSLAFSTDKPDHLTVTLYSVSGAPLWMDDFTVSPGTHTRALSPPADLAPGTYVLGVMGQDRRLTTHRLERQ